MRAASPTDRSAAWSPVRHAAWPRPRTGPLVVASGRAGVARGALRAAELLARRDRVNAHVVGLLRPVELPRWVLDAADANALQDGVRRQRRENLRREVHAAVGRSSLFSTEVLVGEPARTLRDAVRARRAEWILVGLDDPNTPDRVRDERLVAQLARIVDRPVLAVPRGFATLPTQALVVVDDPDAGERVARAAAGVLARGGTLTLAHVAPTVEGDGPVTSSSSRLLARDAIEHLERVASAIGDGGRTTVTVATELLGGDPTTTLLQPARVSEFDLVACGVADGDPRSNGVLAALLDGAAGAVLVTPPAKSSDATPRREHVERS